MNKTSTSMKAMAMFCLLLTFLYVLEIELITSVILLHSIIPGVIISFTLLPERSSKSAFPTFSSYIVGHQEKLSKMLADITPDLGMKRPNEFPLPDYSKEFWTPIDIDLSSASDPVLTLCRLNFKKYSAAPHDTPMFKNLVSASSCDALHKKSARLSELKQQMEDRGEKPLTPTGFVFHEGRVGSTLVANLLGSNPYAMVFSESDPPVNVLTRCHRCTREQQIQLFRDVIGVMGLSPIHQHLFFKFQSISATAMDVALEVRGVNDASTRVIIVSRRSPRRVGPLYTVNRYRR